MNVKIFHLLIFFIYLLITTKSQTETINLKDIDESIQCYHIEKMTFGESEEKIYEIINNKLDKIAFIQFKATASITIYKSDMQESNIIFPRTKEDYKDNNFENYFFNIEKDVNKYIIKIDFLNSESHDNKICFNFFEANVSSFKKISGKVQKIATYEIINSGKFPLFINDNLTSLTALRIKKKYEKYFTISNLHIRAKLLNSDEKINLNIHESFDNEEYKYYIWNLNLKRGQKLKEMVIELHVNIIRYEEENSKLEIEMINNQEIHYEYILKTPDCEDWPKIFYVDLKKYVFEQDMDILSYSSIYNDALYVSDSFNINKENSKNLEKILYVFNKQYLESETFKNMNPNLLFFIIDETFIYNSLNLIFSFIFAGSSHQIYHFNDEIPLQNLFPNNTLTIKSEKCSSFYLINYFSDLDHDYILEYEPIMGNANIYFSNSANTAKTISDFFTKLDSYSIHFLNSSIIEGEFGIFKISCEQNNQNNFLSYINLFKKNEENDVISFVKQNALLYIQKNKQHSFTFDSQLLNEKFKMRIKLLKKDEGQFNIEIKYNDVIYNTLNENNFLELKHEKGENPIIYISMKENPETKKEKAVVLEVMRDLEINIGLVEFKKYNEINSTLLSGKFLFLEYDKKNSTQVNLKIYNKENDNVNICIHTGYGIYPYIIKPECNKRQLINLNKNETLNLIYENPLNNEAMSNNINSDNHLYISLYSNKNVKYEYIYEKYSEFNSYSDFKDIDFYGREIIQLDNNKEYSYMYYQINICQDFNDILEYDSLKTPVFNYYFEEKKDEITLNNIKLDIYNLYELKSKSKKPQIIFNKGETIKAKFKYSFSPIKLNYIFNQEFSKDIKLEQLTDKLKLQLKTPYHGDVILYFLFIVSDFEKYNNLCTIIDLFENLKKNTETQNNYGYALSKKELSINDTTNIIDTEIEAKELYGINRKDVKLYVINELKVINIDLFYNPYKLRININDHFTESENRKDIIKKIIITISCLIIVFLIFIFYRANRRKRRLNEISFDRKGMKLTDDINETSKLF